MLMIRKILLFLVCIFSCFANANEKIITITADPWCPWNCKDLNKPGIAVDLMKAIYEPEGFKVQYIIMPWNEAIQKVKTGEISALIGITQEKENPYNLIFPKNYLNKSNNAYIVRADDDFIYKNNDSLKGKKIGIVDGYHFQSVLGEYINKNYYDPNIVIKSSGSKAVKENLLKLVNGDIDIYVEDEYVIQYIANRNGLISKIRVCGFLSDKDGTYVAFSSASPFAHRFVEMYDVGVTKLKQNGEYNKILAKYGIYE